MFICRVWNVSLRFYREAAISLVRLSAVVVARMMRALGLAVRADVRALGLAMLADVRALGLGVRADVRAVRLSVRADVRAVGLGVRADVRADVLAVVVSSVGGTMMVAMMLMMARTLGHGDRGRGNDSDECKYLVHVCIS